MNLTESELQHIIECKVREELTKYLPLNEMALPRKEYIGKFDQLFPQVLENMTLLIYARNAGGRFERWMGHWCVELKAQMKTLARYSLKRNNSYQARMTAVGQVIEYNDWNTEKAVMLTVHNKMEVEGMTSNEEMLTAAVSECCGLIPQAIEAILSGDTYAIGNFADELVSYSNS